MNTNILTCLTLSMLLLGVMTGCNEEHHLPESGNPNAITVRLATDKVSGSDEESVINRVTGYRFVDGILEEVITPSKKAGTQLYTFAPSSFTGTLHILANAQLLRGLETLDPGHSTLDDFLAIEGSVDEMNGHGILMTGKTTLGESTSAVVPMTRAIARVDIESLEKGVQVQQVVIHNLADKGYALARETVETPASASTFRFTKEYADTPLENRSETLLYLAEQTHPSLLVEATIQFEGGRHLLKAKLPSVIRRNEIYTLKIEGKGADMQLVIESEGWGTGASTETTPSLRGLVDVENSNLSDGVRVNETRDTVFVPYHGSDFRLALLAEADATVTVDGSVSGVEITRDFKVSRSALEKIADIAVRSRSRMPGRTTERIHLDIQDRATTNLGRIVLVIEANPIEVDGAIHFDDDATCDFNDYIEGELGIIHLPAGKMLRVEFDADESAWLQASETESETASRSRVSGRSYRIVGGWKPNDPKADGRTQEGRLVISDEDGTNRESYTIRRINWGLPVVKIGETWWCKYNLRGNVKSFEDQVTIPDDPASHEELLSYLTAAPEDELLALLGDQYQGGNQQGLPLSHNDSVFYHEGVAASAQNFGVLPPTEMAPRGYQIPDYDDYLAFSKNGNFNLGGVGSRSYQNSKGQTIRITIVERDVNFLGHNYGVISFYDFEIDGVHYVLNGLGHQWNTTPGNISRMNLLLATYGSSSQTWVMEGYASQQKPNENWIKYTANNSTKTRVIRCIKTPVEYTYD